MVSQEFGMVVKNNRIFQPTNRSDLDGDTQANGPTRERLLVVHPSQQHLGSRGCNNSCRGPQLENIHESCCIAYGAGIDTEHTTPVERKTVSFRLNLRSTFALHPSVRE